MAQSVPDLKKRAEEADPVDHSKGKSQCDSCRFYREMIDGIGYCAHKDVDMVVGAGWWCKLYEPAKETASSGKK